MDPNGNPSFFTVYSASHNTCGASSYALNSTENMNKGGGKEGKNIPSPALFSTIACCLMIAIFLEITASELLSVFDSWNIVI